MIKKLNKNGNIIIKIYDTYTNLTLKILSIFCISFDK
jgi:hypothetical protein